MTDHILDQLGLVSAERLWSGSEWYNVTVGETRNTRETVAYLRELGCFAQVDYDYIMKGDGEVTSVDVSSNPEYTKQEGYLEHAGGRQGVELHPQSRQASGRQCGRCGGGD